MTAFFEVILSWIGGQILKYLLARIDGQLIDHANEVIRDQERGVINDENTKRYEESLDRKERIKDALDLLNRTKR